MINEQLIYIPNELTNKIRNWLLNLMLQDLHDQAKYLIVHHNRYATRIKFSLLMQINSLFDKFQPEAKKHIMIFLDPESLPQNYRKRFASLPYKKIPILVDLSTKRRSLNGEVKITMINNKPVPNIILYRSLYILEKPIFEDLIMCKDLGNLNPLIDKLQKSITRILNTFNHELTHVIEFILSGRDPKTIAKIKEKKNKDDYFNKPHEYKPWLLNTFNKIKEHINNQPITTNEFKTIMFNDVTKGGLYFPFLESLKKNDYAKYQLTIKNIYKIMDKNKLIKRF